MTEERTLMNQAKEAENLCRWAAARAGVIVVAPGIGTMALIANEVYMIIRIGKVYGKTISQSAAAGFLASLGAAFAGQTLATLLPFPPMQIAIGVSVTYAVGKAAQAWIAADMPSSLDSVRQVFDSAKQEAKTQWKVFVVHPDKDVPLGDETAEIKLLPPGQGGQGGGAADKTDARRFRERLERIAATREKVTRLIAKLPLGGEIAGSALDNIFDDPEVRRILEAIENPRPLRIVFVGRTGAGKSSLINALAGKYLAEVSDVDPGQQTAEKHAVVDGDRLIFEVVDTRGIADGGPGAEAALADALRGFQPDLMFLVSPIDDRSHVQEDIRDIVRIRRQYLHGEIPVIALLTKMDHVQPENEPMDSPSRQANVDAACGRMAGLLEAAGLEPLAIVPVSANLVWSADRQTIVYDGRYNIDKLERLIIDNVEIAAVLQLAFENQMQYAVRKVANRLIGAFSGIAGGIGLNPVPLSDMVVLTSLQVMMVITVAYLGGRDLDEDGVKEFFAGLGLQVPTALVLRQVARMLGPVFGSGVSGAIAAGGTYAIGVSAIAYYIDGTPRSALKEVFQTAQERALELLRSEGTNWLRQKVGK